jgi:hypothetical protein
MKIGLVLPGQRDRLDHLLQNVRVNDNEPGLRNSKRMSDFADFQ